MEYSPPPPNGLEYIFDDNSGEQLALILRSALSKQGVSFLTGHDSTQQLGILCWPQGHIIEAHVHNPVERTIYSTQEVLFVRSGRMRVDLYSEGQEYVVSRELSAGDMVFLSSGGHGFEMLEDSEIIEVKQGPYVGEREKTRFRPVGNPFFENPK